MAPEEKPDELRVIDRRRFTAEGDTKSNDPQPSTGAENVREEARREAPPQSKPARPVDTMNDQMPPLSPDDHRPDFSAFLVSMATQALVLMGEIPDPESGKPILNLSAARESIDMLGVIEEKTRGNLIPEEERLMGEILTSLRLAYVKRARETNAK